MVSEQLLKDKVCVITGGGRGIGAAIAEKFAGQGAILILTARSQDQLQEVTSVPTLSLCRSDEARFVTRNLPNITLYAACTLFYSRTMGTHAITRSCPVA